MLFIYIYIYIVLEEPGEDVVAPARETKLNSDR
jgi:hypothetical protein